MELHIDNRPIFRFSLFQAYWKDKQSAIARYFPEGIETPANKYMLFGSQVANALAERPVPQWVSHLIIPEYDLSEYRIVEEFPECPGVLIRGTLDRYSTEFHRILDDKCTLTKSSTQKQSYYDQILFYQVLVEHRHDWVDPTSYINWIPTAENENGLIVLSGAPAEQLPHTFTDEQRAEMRKKIVETAKEINIVWRSYLEGNIKV